MIHGVFCPRCHNHDLTHRDGGALVCPCGCVFYVRLEIDEAQSATAEERGS